MPSARDALLAAARWVVVAGDWERMPLAELAARAGVSRQTLYKEFGSKDGLAQALSARETEIYLSELATVLEAFPDDPVAGTRAAVAHTLRTGADDPLLKAILSSARGPSELLPLLTTRAEPLLESSRKLLTAYLTSHWPHLSTRDVALVADAAIRLTVSHLVLPLAPIERTAEDIATLVARALPPEFSSDHTAINPLGRVHDHA
ncbi:MAG TPA: TetR family transcriptional regulator [Frankiaceae bacterium]|nr:TetR family transcriptional regulator [Frankiaceae bacterium]